MSPWAKSSKASHHQLGMRDEKMDMEMVEDGVVGVAMEAEVDSGGEVVSEEEEEVDMVEDVGRDTCVL